VLVSPVRLDRALTGAEAPDDAADAPVPSNVESSPDVDDVDGAGWESACSVCGTVDKNVERWPEIAEATLWAWPPTDVAAVLATAAA
jgi:hypothetical protein